MTKPLRRKVAVCYEGATAAPAKGRVVLRLREFSAGFSEPGTLAGAPNTAIVKNVSLELRQGQIMALIGESGSGKTTLCESVLGMNDAWRSGTANLGDINLTDASASVLRLVRGRRIGLARQNAMAALDPVMSIGRHFVTTFRETRGLAARPSLEMAETLLAEVGLADPGGALKRFPHELSGGMNQRVAIALALAGEPEILFADEPTSALDAALRWRVLAILRQLVGGRGLALLLITHDIEQVRAVADRVAVMYSGRIIEEGSAATVLDAPRHPYTRKLLGGLAGAAAAAQRNPSAGGGCAYAPRCELAVDQCLMERPPLAGSAMDRVACWRPVDAPMPSTTDILRTGYAASGSSGEEPPIVLAADNLSKTYRPSGNWFARRAKGVPAANGVSFALASGETLGLVGESGSGKSTIAAMAAGLLRPTSGNLKVAGVDISRGVSRRAHASRAQMIFQDPLGALDPMMAVRDQVAEPLRVHRVGTAQERLDRAAAMLEELGLNAALASARPRALSGGQAQRAAIARALILKPQLLICDEPTSALDPSIRADVLALLERLQGEQGFAMLFITHDLAAVSRIANRLAVLYAGRIVEEGPTMSLLRDPRHPYTQSLVAASAPPPMVPDVVDSCAQGEENSRQPSVAVPQGTGCAYAPQCSLAMPECRTGTPSLRPVAAVHSVACHVTGQG